MGLLTIDSTKSDRKVAEIASLHSNPLFARKGLAKAMLRTSLRIPNGFVCPLNAVFFLKRSS